MPWNGNGTTSLIYNWENDAANSIPISADRMDTQELDIASMIQNCITRDGQAAPQANISWGSYKITNLANGAASGDAVNYGQVFSSGSFADPTFTGTVTGSGATTFTVPTPSGGDNSQKAANTAYLTTYYAPLASPALTGTPTAPTAAVGTNTTQIATMAAIYNQAFSTALPSQTGNSGKFVTTDGTTASWSELLKTGTIRFADSTDTTKRIAFDASAITTGTTRTITMPDSDVTLGSDKYKLLATLTPTASATVNALSVFTSAYDAYVIVGVGITTAAADQLCMQFANSGTLDTGSNYYRGGTFNATAITASSANILVTPSTVLDSGIGCNFEIRIKNTNDATRIKSCVIETTYQQANTPSYKTDLTGNSYTAANAISGVGFFWATGGNFGATGHIYIYGIKNS